MSELPSDPELGTAPAEATPLEPESIPPAVDPAQVSALTEAHHQAVTEAHYTFSQRLENVYSIFKSDLDRAYSIWQTAMQDIRQGVGIVHSVEGAFHASQDDPTRAV